MGGAKPELTMVWDNGSYAHTLFSGPNILLKFEKWEEVPKFAPNFPNSVQNTMS